MGLTKVLFVILFVKLQAIMSLVLKIYLFKMKDRNEIVVENH